MDTIKGLIYKILSLLHKEGCISIIRVSNGVIVRDRDNNNILLCIGEDFLDESIYNIIDDVDLNSTIFPYSKEKILKALDETLFKNLRKSKTIQKEYFLLSQSIEELLNNKNITMKIKSSIQIPNLTGKIVHQFQEENKKIILLKDFKPTYKIHYEIPMIINLQKLWRGKNIHKNFAIVEVTQHGHNILCEFDAIGVIDDILCIFEIKNKNAKEISKFLSHFFKYSHYILEWLKKNQYKINYVAPILYFREKTYYKTQKLNIIYYTDVLEGNIIKLHVLYQNFDGKIFDSEIVNKEVIITKNVESKSEENSESTEYVTIKIPKEYYTKIKDIVKNSEFFNSEEEFIKFAFENAFNAIKLLKKVEE